MTPTFLHFEISLAREPKLRLPAAELCFEAEHTAGGEVVVHVAGLSLGKKPSARTETYGDFLAIDFDAEGDVIAVEVLVPVDRITPKEKLVQFVRAQKPDVQRLLRAALSTIWLYWTGIEVGGRLWGTRVTAKQRSRTSRERWRDPVHDGILELV